MAFNCNMIKSWAPTGQPNMSLLRAQGILLKRSTGMRWKLTGLRFTMNLVLWKYRISQNLYKSEQLFWSVYIVQAENTTFL